MSFQEVVKKYDDYYERYLTILDFLGEKYMETLPANKQSALPTKQHHSVDIMDQSDLILPSALVLNPTSKLTMEGKGAPGDIIEASNYTILAKKGEALEIIPVYTYFDWTKQIKDQKDQTKWINVQKMANPEVMPEKGKWSVETKVGGQDVRYTKTVYLFACLTRDLDAVPVRFSFRGMSANSGKKVSTHFQLSHRLNASPCRQLFNISTKLATFNNNSSFALEFVQGKAASEAQQKQAEMWRQSFAGTKNISVSETHAESEENEAVPF